jgi:sec-independent protein translocase protein TatB
MLSIPHLIIIFVVALVVFGPEKLPELARNVGKFMVEFRRLTGDFKGSLDDHLRDLEREGNARRAAADAATKAAKDAALAAAAQTSAMGQSALAGENAAAAQVPGESTPALPEPPAVTRAEGIVPSADPRVVSEGSPSDPVAASGDPAHEPPANGAGATAEASYHPEPVTDGEHSTH